MDDLKYIKKQEEDLARHESLCRQCGECCGAYGSDPCSNLVKRPEGGYYCKNYKDRLGVQKTVSGKVFTCVTIRDVQKRDIYYSGCGYSAGY